MDGALLDELVAQHRQAESLFEQIEKAETPEEQRPLVDELVAALTQHMEIEETQVYPELTKIDEEAEEEAETEHNLGRDGMATLQQMVGKPGFGAAVAMLKAGIEHHVEEEETEVFPKLRKELGLPPGAESRRSGAGDEPTKAELYEKAKEQDVEGRSTMTKDELAKAVK